MNLAILFDHRYARQPDGSVVSKLHFNYPLLSQRYLRVFDKVKILSRVDDGQYGETPLGPNVSVASLGNWNSPGELLWRYRQVMSQINSYLDTETAVLIITPGAVGNLIAARLYRERRPYGVEVIGDPADSLSHGSVKNILLPLIRWQFCRNQRSLCQHATTASYVTREALQRPYPPNPQAFTTHYSSIELQDEAYVEHSRPIVRKTLWRIVNVGTMSQGYKAQDVLIDAVADCRAKGLDIELVLIGEGKLQVEFERKVRQLALESHVQFLGHLPPGKAIRDQLDRADLFVLPSRTEGLPRAMIEAMARALPCLGSAVGGIPELLEPTELFPVDDREVLAAKIRDLLLDPVRMSHLSQRNLEHSRDYHDQILNARRVSVYEHLRQATERWQGELRHGASSRAA